MYIYLHCRCDSSIGIGKATWHHEFNNDEIGFCLVLGIICPEQIVCISTAIKYAIFWFGVCIVTIIVICFNSYCCDGKYFILSVIIFHFLTDIEKIACTSIRSTYYTFGTTRYILLRWIRIRIWPNPDPNPDPDPDPVCSQRLDPDPVQIGPDPQQCFKGPGSLPKFIDLTPGCIMQIAVARFDSVLHNAVERFDSPLPYAGVRLQF
jgi:hypothetical protein